jgi:hypothetical protein
MIIFTLLVIFAVISLVGFIYLNNSNNNNAIFVSESVRNLGLDEEDLPENISQFVFLYNDTEGFDDFTENVLRLEQYSVDYRNETEGFYILVELKRIESTDGAIKVFESQRDIFVEFISNLISTEGIGDQSILGAVDDRYHLLLRKYNVILTLTSASGAAVTDQEIINYAKIIENKIESSVTT